MIPYFQFTTFQIGFLTIQVWGLLVALGIFCATFVAATKAKRDGLDPNIVWDFAFWVIISAFVGARLFELAYEPVFYFSHPLELFKFWQGGFSEMGGIIGAVVGLSLYFKTKNQYVWRYIDCISYALPLGFGIGRIGCFMIHDHPGTLTHFFLGVKYPDGIRHDGGLELSLEGFLLFLLFSILNRKGAKPGTFVVTFLIIHGIARFFLDFFRTVDVRYFFLTPGQFISVFMVLVGIGLVWYRPFAHRA